MRRLFFFILFVVIGMLAHSQEFTHVGYIDYLGNAERMEVKSKSEAVSVCMGLLEKYGYDTKYALVDFDEVLPFFYEFNPSTGGDKGYLLFTIKTFNDEYEVYLVRAFKQRRYKLDALPIDKRIEYDGKTRIVGVKAGH